VQLLELYIAILKKYTPDMTYISTCLDFLVKQYSSSSRPYHNLQHLTFMMDELQRCSCKPDNRDALILSIYYHDIIYKASKKDNEMQSAIVLEKHLSKTDFKHIHLCKESILATKEHKKSTNSDINLLLDLDLAILGQTPETYISYTQKIRKEYCIYPNFLYKPARRKAMIHFLEQEQIFKTDEFFDKYENQARENIKNEIASLS
jgi:predicted metal-dependent HD superfamily phosphohydrolase